MLPPGLLGQEEQAQPKVTEASEEEEMFGKVAQPEDV
jgi:hypothetical protein